MNNTYIEFNKELMSKYNYALKMLETEINILIDEFTIKNKYNPVEHIKSRIKSPDSIIKKLCSRGYEVNNDNIVKHVHDVVGIRIVCSFLTDVYDIVHIIEHSKLLKIKDRKDYISTPKESGYTSYHIHVLVPIYLTTGVEYVEAEIQIRTVAMDFWASLDHKISYKFKENVPKEIIDQMYNYAQDIKQIDKKMLDLNYIMNKYKD